MEESNNMLRLFTPQSPTTRQTTRTLQELSGRGTAGLFNLREMGNNLEQNVNNQATVVTNRQLHLAAAATTPPVLRDNNISGIGMDSFLSTHTPSPDEAVIQARGRRQVPLTFSPDITPLRQQMQRSKLTNVQQQSNCSRLSLPNIRISPRKRLTLSDTPPSPQMYVLPPEIAGISPLAKKLKLDEEEARCTVDPSVAVKGLGHAQLVQLISDIVKRHPNIRNDVVSLLPTPDLTIMEESLNTSKKNIFKSLPNTRLESKTDSMAFNRVATHLSAFRKVVSEGVKRLQSGEQWSSLLDYTIMAWSYVQATPVWDNPSHNATRKTCFKSLASAALAALKTGNFTVKQLTEIRAKFTKLSPKTSELEVCMKHMDNLIENNLEG